MAYSNAYTLYANNIATTAGVDVFIKQVQDFAVDTAIQNALRSADGDVDPTYVTVMNQSPRISFTTTYLATTLAVSSDAFMTAGLKIDSDGDDDGSEFWFRKCTEGGTRETGASHIKLTVNEGLLLPRTITATQGQPATLALDTIITYDGSNDPIVLATSSSLEGTTGVSELYTLGKVTINGTDVDGVQSWVWDAGIREMVRGADGDVWPTYACIMDRMPTLTVTTPDVSLINTYGISGTAVSASDVIFYLRHCTEGGTRVADATETHIKFTLDEGIIQTQTINGSHPGELLAQLIITPTYDGSNSIVVVDTTAAIT